MKVTEKTFVLKCEAEELIAVVHLPEAPRAVGLIAVAAGSLQYRIGNGRQLVLLARSLAEVGIPVMRFDYRGMGDSDGAYRGFEHIELDLKVAVSAFEKELPGLRSIALYGGCEAAAGIMMHASMISGVDRLILANPWVGDEEITARAMKKHYTSRLTQADFWRGLLRGRYAFSEYYVPLKNAIRAKFRPKKQEANSGLAAIPFQQKMLQGLQRYQGTFLLLMSGNSLLRQEFDTLVESSEEWRKVFSRSNFKRIDQPLADQSFSTVGARQDFISVIQHWISQSELEP